MCLEDHTQQCLFIMDSHNSYMIANFIAFCMEYLIDLFILFLHILRLFQLLDVGIFALLKHVLTEETDVVFQFNFNHILRAN